jgi:predicted AlkP superfamily phosphohydrolase/phosphomutase
MNELILIGIDGATPQLIDKWVGQGKLPTFKKIQQQGCWGSLESTIPPFSAPAWTSIVTGCNPGKHGIYGFESTGTLSPRLITSRSRKVPAIWNYLTQVGLKNIIINVPGSYPPDTINGVMITGLLTPSFDSQFTYPSSLKNRLHDRDLGTFELEHFWLEDFSRSRMKERAPEKLLNLIKNQMETRATVALNLMQTIPWNFTMVVFRGTDTAQHFLYHRSDLILQCYQKVDALIQQLITSYPKATCIIVSDHGFEPINMVLYPDNVLYNHGYLMPTSDPFHSYSALVMSTFNVLLQRFFKILSNSFIHNSPRLKQLLLSNATKENLIDFSQTKAFSNADGRGLQICNKEKYPNGIVTEKESQQLQEALRKIFNTLHDPKTGQKLVKQTYSPNEVYGSDPHKPPDLIFSLENGVTASEWIRFPQTIKELLKTKPRSLPYLYHKDTAGRSGDHAKDGIFYAYGNKFKNNHHVQSISVEDILPIIFSIMNLPIPPNITGKIPTNLFHHQSIITSDWNVYLKKQKTLTSTELNKIKELQKGYKILK